MKCPKCGNEVSRISLMCFQCGSVWKESDFLADAIPDAGAAQSPDAIHDAMALENEVAEFSLSRRRMLYDCDMESKQKELDQDFANRQREQEFELDMRQREASIRRDDEDIAFQRQRQSLFDADELEVRKSQREIEKLRAMTELKRQMQEDKARQQQSIAERYQHMSADQILASQVADMDASAQAELAKSRSSERENEILREVINREHEAAEADKDRMERLFEQFADRLSDRRKASGENSSETDSNN